VPLQLTQDILIINNNNNNNNKYVINMDLLL